MKDVLLEALFEQERWEKALQHGLDKSMNRADLYRYAQKDERIKMYKKADDVIYEKNDLEIVGDELGYACCENGTDAEYDYRPYPDEK